MATQVTFTAREHVIPGQYVREYERGVADEGEDYYIHAKQYTPVYGIREPQKNDATIIAAAGIGMIKESYQPFFEELASQCQERGLFIRGFWIADMGCVGKSALLNADNLGSEQSWFDHSRDLLCMINHFRKEMPRPLVGLGHSMGGCQIGFLSTLHPHLFHTLLLVEPAIYRGLERRTALAQTRAMVRRREYWSNRIDAEAAIKKNPFYKLWHPSAISLLIENSLVPPSQNPRVPVPAANDSEKNDADAVVNTTPRSMEVSLITKPNFRGVGNDEKDTTKWSTEDREAAPDVDPGALHVFPFYRPEGIAMFKRLPTLRPSVCYLLGTESTSSSPEIRKARLENTGIGVGGSGGATVGRVVERLIEGGHFIPFETHAGREIAKEAAVWLRMEIDRFIDSVEKHADWKKKSPDERIQPDKVMVEALTDWHPQKSPDIEQLVKSRL